MIFAISVQLTCVISTALAFTLKHNEARSTKAIYVFPSIKKLTSSKKCRALPFNMDVYVDGCEKLTVQNNLCYGGCNTLYVPHDRNTRKIQACYVCAPLVKEAVPIPLTCTKRDGGKFIRFTYVTFIQMCECRSKSCRRTWRRPNPLKNVT